MILNNFSIEDLNVSDMVFQNNPGYVGHTLSFNDVLSKFSDDFIFRLEVVAVMFLILSLFMTWYTKQIEIEYKIRKNWYNYVVEKTGTAPILNNEPDLSMSIRDSYLCIISDICFIPSLAFPLIFLGYETGWYI